MDLHPLAGSALTDLDISAQREGYLIPGYSFFFAIEENCKDDLGVRAIIDRWLMSG
jgi:hypothetical protein